MRRIISTVSTEGESVSPLTEARSAREGGGEKSHKRVKKNIKKVKGKFHRYRKIFMEAFKKKAIKRISIQTATTYRKVYS